MHLEDQLFDLQWGSWGPQCRSDLSEVAYVISGKTRTGTPLCLLVPPEKDTFTFLVYSSFQYVGEVPCINQVVSSEPCRGTSSRLIVTKGENTGFIRLRLRALNLLQDWPHGVMSTSNHRQVGWGGKTASAAGSWSAIWRSWSLIVMTEHAACGERRKEDGSSESSQADRHAAANFVYRSHPLVQSTDYITPCIAPVLN